MNSNVCPECGRYKSAAALMCRNCRWPHALDEPLYCTCPRPDIDGIDQCRHCLRAHKATVYRRYGWPLEEAS